MGATQRNRLLIVTGAGISAESGIPTFRSAGGYWRNLDPTKLATPEAFDRDPLLVWDWYRERRDHIRKSRPNPAHEAVVQLAASFRSALVLTQNVDDLHARARSGGSELSEDQLVQIHGDIFVTRCSSCSYRQRDTTGDAPGIPMCPKCDRAMRPGVTWFGELLDQRQVQRVQRFLEAGPCDTTIVVGTTATFGYIVDWSVAAMGDSGELIEVNPEASGLSRYATETIREPAAIALPRIAQLKAQDETETS